jgi:hypothetical protein
LQNFGADLLTNSHSGGGSDEIDEPVDDSPFSSSDLDGDTRVGELARNAARSFHQLKGLIYDESTVMDLYTDVKFSVVELKLPLGRKTMHRFICLVLVPLVQHLTSSAQFLFFFSFLIVVFLENDGELTFTMW